MASLTVPPELVHARAAFLEAQISKHREELQKEYKTCMNGLPKELLAMTLRDLLLLTDIASLEYTAVVPPSASKRQRLGGDSDVGDINVDGRRVTRSMARTSSIYVSATRPSTTDVPSTPKLHPLLPETPAVLRKAIRLAKAADGTLPPAAEDDFKRPVRIARSTIRAVQEDQQSNENNVFKAPIARKSRKSVRHSTATKSQQPQQPADSTVVSLELSDGKVLDVDLSQSPKTMFKGMGKEAVKEVKGKMQAYAMQLRAFFKKLNF